MAMWKVAIALFVTGVALMRLAAEAEDVSSSSLHSFHSHADDGFVSYMKNAYEGILCIISCDSSPDPQACRNQCMAYRDGNPLHQLDAVSLCTLGCADFMAAKVVYADETKTERCVKECYKCKRNN